MNRKIQELYTGMYSKEPIIKEEVVFEKFALNDYTKLINENVVEEGYSGHGDLKIVTNALKEAIAKGLIDVKETKNGWIVKSKKHSNLMETIHKGERAFHYLRRFLQKLEA